MAKKARKKSKAKSVRRAKRVRPQAKKARRAKTRRAKTRRTKTRAKPASAFQVMIDTINETERMRTLAEPHDSD
jgi:hypothetical protein